MRLRHDRGEGVTLQLGEGSGAPFLSAHLGHMAWRHKGGDPEWHYVCNPTISVGRLFRTRFHHSKTWELELPARWVDRWRRLRKRHAIWATRQKRWGRL
jgi:hypothetical protein